MNLGEWINRNPKDETHDEFRGVQIEARQNEKGEWLAYWGNPEEFTLPFLNPADAITNAKECIKSGF